jgi:hypothetical protein
MPTFCALIRLVTAVLIGMLCATRAATAQGPGPVQPWGRRAWQSLGRIAGLGGIIQINPRGLILGYVPIPNNDAATIWRFKAPYPGLIGPGGVRLPAQP